MSESQWIQAVADLRVDMATLNGKVDMTNQRLEAVIVTLKEAQRNRKWLVTTALTGIATAATLIYFLVRLG